MAGWGLGRALCEEEEKPGILGRVPGTLENSVSPKQTHRMDRITDDVSFSRLLWLTLLFDDVKTDRTRISTL